VSGAGSDTASRISDHKAWWTKFWQEGASIDLGANQSTLEGFYYAMRYQMGSGTRPGHTAPGLYGPWQTVEVQGFQGDYTTDYNFQAPVYGTFSDNQPELARAHMDAALTHVEMGKWRASMAYWGDWPELWQAPGFWSHMFGPQYQLANDTNGKPPWSVPFPQNRQWTAQGTGLVKAGYRGIELPNVLR